MTDGTGTVTATTNTPTARYLVLVDILCGTNIVNTHELTINVVDCRTTELQAILDCIIIPTIQDGPAPNIFVHTNGSIGTDIRVGVDLLNDGNFQYTAWETNTGSNIIDIASIGLAYGAVVVVQTTNDGGTTVDTASANVILAQTYIDLNQPTLNYDVPISLPISDCQGTTTYEVIDQYNYGFTIDENTGVVTAEANILYLSLIHI